MAVSAAGFADIGSAASSIFSGVGQLQSSKGYKQAAAYAGDNAEIAQQAANIQSLMATRQVYKTIGGQQADIAGAGLANSGSATDLLRSSAQQGSLTKQLVSAQGAINVLGYQAEQASYESMAASAKTSGIGGLLGGAVKIGAAVAMFSDDRLKHNVALLERRQDGLGIYEFSYRGTDQRFRGVMASEVERIYPAAVSWEDGFRKVDYAVIGVTPEAV